MSSAVMKDGTNPSVFRALRHAQRADLPHRRGNRRARRRDPVLGLVMGTSASISIASKDTGTSSSI